MAQHDLLQGIKPGQIITADWLNKVKNAINANTQAIKTPYQKDLPAGTGDEGSGEATAVGDESFSAGASDITSTTVTITDDGGNDHDIERIDTIVFTEDTTGRKMTLDITYT